MLARQLLLERARLSLPRALERVGGIQAQYAPSMYIGLWTRLADFERAALTRALERRTVAQGTLMRVTIHLVSARDYWPFALAVREARRARWLRAERAAPDAAAMEEAARTLRARLADGPLHRREIEALLGKTVARGVGLWVDLVRAPPSGTWARRRADLWALADVWVPPPASPGADARVPPPGGAGAPECAVHLMRRYLAAFGPATRAGAADWSGLPLRVVDAALAQLRLRRFRAEDGAELVDLPRMSLPPASTPAPVRLLPQWDATLLAHARRAAILPEEHRPKVFSSRNPHSLGTFLVDGAVAGAWREDGGRIDVEPWERLSPSAERALRGEAAELERLHA